MLLWFQGNAEVSNSVVTSFPTTQPKGMLWHCRMPFQASPLIFLPPPYRTAVGDQGRGLEVAKKTQKSTPPLTQWSPSNAAWTFSIHWSSLPWDQAYWSSFHNKYVLISCCCKEHTWRSLFQCSFIINKELQGFIYLCYSATQSKLTSRDEPDVQPECPRPGFSWQIHENFQRFTELDQNLLQG